MHRRQYLAAVGTATTLATAGCGESSDGSDDAATPDDDSNNDPPESDAESQPNDSDETPEQEAELERNSVGFPSDYLDVHDVEMQAPENDYSGPSVTGVADNVSGQELNYVEVSIQAFNDNDEQIGDALDNTSDLREGKSWRFEAELFDVDDSEMAYWMGRAEVTTY